MKHKVGDIITIKVAIVKVDELEQCYEVTPLEFAEEHYRDDADTIAIEDKDILE